MAEWMIAPDLRDLAERVIARRPDVEHVDPAEVLFLWELETKPKRQGFDVLARTYSLHDHPIQALTPERFAVVFYRENMEHLSARQQAILMWHKLKHIPDSGDQLKPHTVQDFGIILSTAGLDWEDEQNADEVPDILADEADSSGLEPLGD